MTDKKQLDKIVDKAVDASFKNSKLDEVIVMSLVKKFKSMHLTASIYTLSKYVKGLKRLLAQQTMVIESVIPLSPTQISKVKGKLTKLFTINKTEVTINPDILGGLRIKVGDTVLDYSVRSKLNQIKEAIING